MSLEAVPQPTDSSESVQWIDVCALEEIDPGTGVAALIAGEQVAVVRTRANELYALSNYDPFSKAFVLSRGIVGSKGDVQKIASPIFKQCFDLRTGICLDDPSVKLPTYPVRVAQGRVCVGAACKREGGAR